MAAKTSLKKVNLRSSSLSRLLPPVYVIKSRRTPRVEVECQGSLPKCRKRNKILSHLFTPSLKCKIMQFHVEIVQKRQRNIQKSVMPVQSCRFPSKPIVVVVVVVFFSSSLYGKLVTDGKPVLVGVLVSGVTLAIYMIHSCRGLCSVSRENLATFEKD